MRAAGLGQSLDQCADALAQFVQTGLVDGMQFRVCRDLLDQLGHALELGLGRLNQVRVIRVQQCFGVVLLLAQLLFVFLAHRKIGQRQGDVGEQLATCLGHGLVLAVLGVLQFA